MDEGWIKLHRKMLDWEWYSDLSVKAVFIHLLLVANSEDKKWRGITIHRGEHLTSWRKLSNEVSLALSTVQDAIKKLQSTNEVSVKSSKGYTVFKINNYDDYQEVQTVPETVPTSVPISGTIGGNKQEYKNINIINSVDMRTCEEQLGEIMQNQMWIEAVCMNNHISMQNFNSMVEEFKVEMAAQGRDVHISTQDLQSHINSYIRKRLEIKRKQQRNGNKTSVQGERGIADKDEFIRSTLQAIEDARRQHSQPVQ